MRELIRPDVRLFAAFSEMAADWPNLNATAHGMSDDIRPFETEAEFAEWVAALKSREQVLEPGRVACSYFWIVDGDTMVGGISLRHELNEQLLQHGGHIGYSVRPSARGAGIATWATREVLVLAQRMGIQQVLITCDDSNPASAAVIEKCGGVLEDIRDGSFERDPGARSVRRYWVPTGASAHGSAG